MNGNTCDESIFYFYQNQIRIVGVSQITYAVVLVKLQRGTPIERSLSDGGNAVGNGYACQRSALVKRPLFDRSNAVRNDDAFKRFAPIERILPDRDNAARNDDAFKRFAPIERTFSDRGDAVRDCYAFKRSATFKRMLTDRGNGQAVMSGRNNDVGIYAQADTGDGISRLVIVQRIGKTAARPGDFADCANVVLPGMLLFVSHFAAVETCVPVIKLVARPVLRKSVPCGGNDRIRLTDFCCRFRIGKIFTAIGAYPIFGIAVFGAGRVCRRNVRKVVLVGVGCARSETCSARKRHYREQ